MKQVCGAWMPDDERHLAAHLERLDGQSYQETKRLAALGLVKQWRLAIDIGAHVGLWAAPLAAAFEQVLALEPIAANRECFARNVTAPNVTLLPFAAGERDGAVAMTAVPRLSMDGFVDEAQRAPGPDDYPHAMRRLDSIVDGAAPVDFVKVDCAGYEEPALRGAEAMLRRCRPVVIVDQKGQAERYGRARLGAVEFLLSLGAGVRQEIKGDFILSW